MRMGEVTIATCFNICKSSDKWNDNGAQNNGFYLFPGNNYQRRDFHESQFVMIKFVYSWLSFFIKSIIQYQHYGKLREIYGLS